MEKISVVIIAFNSEKTIERCLKSVCEQTHVNLEILVVYKEGTDHTLDVIKNRDDERISIIEQTENSGPGGARNLGIKHASGEYIGFVESDDYISPNYYEMLYTEMTRENAEIAVADTIVIAHGQESAQQHSPLIKGSFCNVCLELIHGGSFDKLYKTKLLIDNGILFLEKIRWEDNLFTLQAIFHSKNTIFVKDVYYYYAPGIRTIEYEKSLVKDVVPAAKPIINFAATNATSKKEYNLLIIQMLRFFVLCYYEQHKEVKQGIDELIKIPFSIKLHFLTQRILKKIKRILWQK